MLKALGDDAEGERLDASDSLVWILTVGHDTQTTQALLPANGRRLLAHFNPERHNGNVPSGPAV
jgi:hypothetical protein